MKFYNEDIKMQFILNHSPNEHTQYALEALFKKTKSTEEEYGIDLYNFSVEYLSNLFMRISPKTKKTLDVYKSFINSYQNWAIQNSLHATNINATTFITDDMLKGCVNVIAQKYQYYKNREQFFDLIRHLVNYQDQVIAVLAFEGLNNEEIINLREKDVDLKNGIINLEGRKVQYLDPRSITIIENAIDEQTYHAQNGELTDTIRYYLSHYKLMDDGYVVKLRANAKLRDPSVVNRRFSQIITVYTDMPLINPQKAKLSGMNILISKIVERNNGEYNTDEIKKLIGEKYNIKLSTPQEVTRIKIAHRKYLDAINVE